MNIKGNLFNNIVFVGGIHGVGKSTICDTLANDLKIIHLAASDVLRWKDINVDAKNKLVGDISDTQDRLINGLKNIVDPGNHYILDGHFCLFNDDGIAIRVPLMTFITINPIYLVVIKGDVEKISEGLMKRDKKKIFRTSFSIYANHGIGVGQRNFH